MNSANTDTPIAGALRSLQNSISGLTDARNMLGEKLQPVLRPDACKVAAVTRGEGAPTTAPGREPQCPLADTLDDLTRMVFSIQQSLEELTSRCEL